MAIEHVPAGMPAGWYRDSDPAQLRWWDGAHWTDRVKGAVESPASLRALNTTIGDPFVERNRAAALALAVGIVVLALAGAGVAGTAMLPWALPVTALVGGTLTLVLSVVAGRRVEYTGAGRGATVGALVLSGVLMLAGLTGAVMQLALAAL